MNSMHHHSSFFNRNTFIWFFITVSLLYILYSSNLLLNNHRNCPTTPHHLSKQEIINSSLHNITNHNITKHNITNHSITNHNITKNATRVAKPKNKKQEEQQRPHTTKIATNLITPTQKYAQRYDYRLKDIVFGIAGSAVMWERRKEYIKVWYRPKEMRGIVWLDHKVNTSWEKEGLPEIRVSDEVSQFKYTKQPPLDAAVRISRVVSETVRRGFKDVKWFVMGDDDTIFVVDNLLRILSKYDHRNFYYVGSSSESHIQNIFFSYSMAFGGGGFAISYPLAIEIEKMQDRCLHRYPTLYSSDDRVQACMAELGVPLTKENGFHQYDVIGDLLGLLGAHPVTPLVTLHHLDVVGPIFPEMTRAEALHHLMEPAKLDSASIIQQSICYDNKRYWSISVSWGYVIQILRGVLSPRELEMPSRTFLNWQKKADFIAYSFNTRPVTKHPCQTPFYYFMRTVRYDERTKHTVGYYTRFRSPTPPCNWQMESPEEIDTVVVFKKPDPFRWQQSPRRDCCRVLPSKKSSTLHIWVGKCREGEVVEILNNQ